jgi:hypothetical protein
LKQAAEAKCTTSYIRGGTILDGDHAGKAGRAKATLTRTASWPDGGQARRDSCAPASVDLVSMIGSLVPLLRSRAFLSFVVATAFTIASWFSFLAAAPYLLAERLHEPPNPRLAVLLCRQIASDEARAHDARNPQRVAGGVNTD